MQKIWYHWICQVKRQLKMIGSIFCIAKQIISITLLIRALQVTQNKAMRAVTGLTWFTPTRVLLRKCDWLSVRQLIDYHTILTMHKTAMTGNPVYVFDKFATETHHNTRRKVKFSENFSGRSERTKSSFCYRGATLYNQLPIEIMRTTSSISFKKKLKTWLRNNIPVD